MYDVCARVHTVCVPHLCIHSCMHPCVYLCVQLRVSVACVHVCARVQLCVHLCVFISVCAHVCISACSSLCVHMRVSPNYPYLRTRPEDTTQKGPAELTSASASAGEVGQEERMPGQASLHPWSFSLGF
jgi:hypothetical protein